MELNGSKAFITYHFLYRKSAPVLAVYSFITVFFLMLKFWEEIRRRKTSNKSNISNSTSASTDIYLQLLILIILCMLSLYNVLVALIGLAGIVWLETVIYGLKFLKYVVRCAIWYHLYNLTKVKNTPPWLFFTFFKLYKWYQIAQRITYFDFSSSASIESIKI